MTQPGGEAEPRILLVDDEVDMLQAYQSILSPAPRAGSSGEELRTLDDRLFEGRSAPPAVAPTYDLACCGQAEEAVEAVRSARDQGRPFAVCFLDVRMPPGRDGVWAAREIRGLDPDTELVIVTAYSDIDPAEISAQVPPLDQLLYIQKPIFPHEVHQFAAALTAKWSARRRLALARAELASRNRALQSAKQHLEHELAERKRLSVELDRMFRAMEQVEDAVIITDASGKVQYVNPAFEQITGYPREEVLGLGVDILRGGSHDEDRSMWETLRSGKTWSGRLTRRRRDGSNYVEEATFSPVLDLDSSISNFVAVSRDVTQEVQQEARSRQQQRMEVLGRLAGGLAHDFNNLLTAIGGYGSLLVEKLEEEHPARRYALEVQRGTDRAAALTEQLLAFSRGQVVETEILDLSEVLVLMRGLLATLVREDIKLITTLDQDLPRVQAQGAQLEQVVLNLAVNACDAMPGGGTLRITTRSRDLTQEEALASGLDPGSYVVLSLQDSGVGMDEETRAHIFEPFFTTKEKGRGTGLGLATVYGIVQNAGGAVLVESQPGSGTRFDVYWPARTETVSRAHAPPNGGLGPSGAGTILVAEDDDHVRSLAVQVLEELGYQILEARDGEDALRISEQHRGVIDLLVTDVIMPGLHGPEVARRILQTRPDTRVLFMSGWVEDARKMLGASGMEAAFLAKPFTPQVLGERVQTLLCGKASPPA